MKDIEWLKETLEERIDTMAKFEDVSYSIGLKEAYQHTLLLINQLDEPEVLSQKWIDEHAKAVTYDGIPDQTEIVYVDDLQNLLVPKQELPVIPKFVAEVIVEHKELGYDVYDSIDLIIETNGGGLPSISNWVARNIDKYARAWLDGYTVEEEQKYVVELPNPNNQMGRHKNVFLNKEDGKVFIDSASLFVNDITKYGQFALTEEEIKKDFEWAWEFAKPVEELEE